MPMLSVPYKSQWDWDALLRRTDCGPACIWMLLAYYYKLRAWTVDRLVQQTALMSRDNGLTPDALVLLASEHDLALVVHPDTTLDDIRAEIDAKRPVIVLIAYRYILNRFDQRDNVPGRDGHFFVIVGYDASHFVACDPDYWGEAIDRGHNVLVSITDLQHAIDGANDNGKCIFSKEVEMPIDIATAKANLQDAQTRLQAALADLEHALITLDGPTPLPMPPSTVLRYVGARPSMNVRGGPGTAYPDVGDIDHNTAVVVNAISVNGWYQIAQGAYIGQWLSGNLLTPDRS